MIGPLRPSDEAALELLASPKTGFDLIFLDWIMPGLTGEEVIAAIKAAPAASQAMLVVVSASNLEEVYRSNHRSNISHILAKPVLPRNLRALLRHAFPDTATIEPTSPATARPQLQGMRLLVAEDNLVNQQIVAEMLSYHGAAVDVANNGREALDKVNEKPDNHYHAILMDIQMPVMDGYQATRQLRSQPGYALLPIIAMTAHAMNEERERCAAIGMNAHIAKPFALDTLLQTLKPYAPIQPEPVTTDVKPKATTHDLQAMLRDLLDESDSAAQDFWREHQSTLRAALPPAMAQQLNQAIINFQFEDALHLLASLPDR